MAVLRGKQIREGKAKILFETEPAGQSVIQFFKNDATAFNAQKKGTIENKGKINNSISCWLFQFLEKAGVPTHFIEKIGEQEMLAKKVQIVPVEVVVRNRAAGSICKRLGIEKGLAFKSPLVEFFYKEDALGDPLIGESHILQFGWATQDQLDLIKKRALQVNASLSSLFSDCGLELIDFKLEFGMQGNELLLADEFSPDGCRLWDKATGESMDKDRFRLDLGKVSESYEEVYQRLSRYFGRAR